MSRGLGRGAWKNFRELLSHEVSCMLMPKLRVVTQRLDYHCGHLFHASSSGDANALSQRARIVHAHDVLNAWVHNGAIGSLALLRELSRSHGAEQHSSSV